MAIKDIELEEKIDKKELNKEHKFHPVENYDVSNHKSTFSEISKIFGILVLIFVVLLIIAFSIFTFLNNRNQNIISGIYIKGIDVSNLSIEEAKEKIQNYIDENLPENINLVHNDYETSIPLSALNVNFDVDSAVNYAYQIGKSGNIFENSITALKTIISNINIEPDFSLDTNQLQTALNDITRYSY